MADRKKADEEVRSPQPQRRAADAKDNGILRREGVEGGEELSIGGGPPSAAGGMRSPSAPTLDRDDD